jgi:phosphatidate cytidylyltransferase
MLRWRIALSIVLVTLVVALVWLDHRAELPGAWLMPLVMALTVLATGEALQLASKAGFRPLAWGVQVGNLLIVVAAWAPLAVERGEPFYSPQRGALALAMLGLAMFAVFLAEVRRFEKPGQATGNIAASLFVLAYVGVLMAVLVQFRMFFGIVALATLVAVVKMGDIGGYTVGRLFGRHKMAPVISPGKTIEGAAGHLAFSALGAWACLTWLDVPFAVSWWQPVAFGLIVGAAGLVGDLAESLLKRDVGSKDSSTWLPGFGGVLDVLDSILLAGPVGWVCWVVLLGP